MAKSKTKFKWNMKGFRALRTDPAVAADLQRRAHRIAAAAGEGFEVGEEQAPRNRAHATVYTATEEAKADGNKLLTALQAGRG